MGAKLFIKKNLVALIMVPVIIGGHYTWYKLQEDERFVSAKERSQLPFMKKSSLVSYAEVPDESHLKVGHDRIRHQ